QQMRLPIHQVVDLHEIDLGRAEAPHRSLHLLDARLPTPSPYLRRQEWLSYVRLQFTDDFFGLAVHRRGVEDTATRCREAVHHFDERPAAALAGDVERFPRPEADDRHLFAAPGDLALMHRYIPCSDGALAPCRSTTNVSLIPASWKCRSSAWKRNSRSLSTTSSARRRRSGARRQASSHGLC